MTTWWWVRHGPTHEKAFTGWRDVPADLSDLDQIGRLNAFLPKKAVVVASDLIRASDTADVVSNGRKRLPDTSVIREFDFGIWDGMHWTEVAKRDPDLSRAYWEKPGDIRAPQGESWNDACDRITPFIDQMSIDFIGQDIIAVAHFGSILVAVQHALKATAYDVMSHKIDNLSVTKLTVNDGVWAAKLINHIP